jgi:plastocyanin
MRRWLFLLTLAVGLVLAPTAVPATTGVSITSTGFRPASVTVPSGNSVTWTNDDSTKHQVVANDGSFSSPVLAPKQSFTRVFKAGGTFVYHDGLHPALKGTVTVIPPRTVWITGNGFVPSTISILTGQAVTWVNRTTANQQVLADDASFASTVLAPRASFSHTFSTAGTFGYRNGLQPTMKGTVVVTTPRAGESITLSSSARIVTYGSSVELTGTVANGTAGEKVTITANPQAGKFTKSTQTVSAGAGGAFSATVRPLVNTVYVAETAKSRSDPRSINVRPRLRLAKANHGRAIVRVAAAQSFARKSALLQVRRAGRGVWSTIARVRLTRATVAASPTVVTSAVFRLRVRHGLRVRVMLPLSRTAPAYVSGVSNVIRR